MEFKSRQEVRKKARLAGRCAMRTLCCSSYQAAFSGLLLLLLLGSGCAVRSWRAAEMRATDPTNSDRTIGTHPVRLAPEIEEVAFVQPAEAVTLGDPEVVSTADAMIEPTQPGPSSIANLAPDDTQHDEFILVDSGDPHPMVATLSASASFYAPPPRTATQLPRHVRYLTLDEAIQTALANGTVVRELGGRVMVAPDATPTAFDAAIRDNDPVFGTHAALSEFDSSFAAEFLYDKNDRVFNNLTLGGGAQELLQDLTSLQSELRRTTLSGAQFALRSVTAHDRNNRQNNLFGHVWESQWEAEVRQPLLQGAGSQFNQIAGPRARPGLNFSSGILISRLNTEITQAEFEISIQQFVNDVIDAYWTLHLAYQGHASREGARDAARGTWNKVRSRFDQGLQGGEADKESQAKAQYYLYEDLALEYLNGSDRVAGIYEAERALRRLMGIVANDGPMLRPSQTVSSAKVVYDWESLLTQALATRVELERQRRRIRQSELRLIAARDFLFPRLDALARYRVRGFGDDLAGSGGRFASAYQDQTDFDHQEWGFGLQLDVPLGYRAARAGVRQAELQLARERAILCDQQHEVARRLSDAVSRVAQTHASMQSAQARRVASEERVAATDSAYEAGRASIDLLLDAQERYYEACLRDDQAQVAYMLAMKDVTLQSGQLLGETAVAFTEPQ